MYYLCNIKELAIYAKCETREECHAEFLLNADFYSLFGEVQILSEEEWLKELSDREI